MKTSILRTAGFAIVIFLMSGFAAKAQESFCDTKWDNHGNVVSKTKFEMGYYGMYEPKYVAKYAYDEKGGFLKKEVCVWNPKYVLNDKSGRYEPDYSESNWTPQYCILQKKDLKNNFVTFALQRWNRKQKAYDAPVETMIFQQKDSNKFNYLAFSKGTEYEVVTNLVKIDNGLLAKRAE